VSPRAVALVAAATLAAAPAAGAKEDPMSVEFCGPSACTTAAGQDVVAAVSLDGLLTVDTPPPAPYVALGPPGRLYHGDLWYVPRPGLLAAALPANLVTGEKFVVWYRPNEQDRRVLRRVADRVEPYPTPAITRVRVGGDTITGRAAASYARLWRAGGERVAASAAPSDWREIDLLADAPSPWTVERVELLYAARENVLARGRAVVRLPDGLAADIEGLRALEDGRGLGRAWLPAGLLLLAALVLRTALRRA
jgi:hypothetical protein